MKIFRAYKTELDLNNKQSTYCALHIKAARFTYNWGLSRKIEAYQQGKRMPDAFELSRELTILKSNEFSWLFKVSKCAPQEALKDLDRAYAYFFQRLKAMKSGKNIKTGSPKFKRKDDNGSFRLTGIIRVFEKHIQLPRLGRVRLKERGYLPVGGIHILSATVSRKAGRWFVSLQAEVEISETQNPNRPNAGIDLGINRMVQVSDGTCFENPHALKSKLATLKLLQRVMTRRKKGGCNYSKAKFKLAKAHIRVANIRKDALHKATTYLAKTKAKIVMENLNVLGMMKNRFLGQSIADVGMFELKRQLVYKGSWYGCQIYLADRFFPSTKRCSRCGNIKPQVDLGMRIYRCEICGLEIDRDLNASINLEQLLN